MVEAIPRRSDVEGCGCVRCRGVDTAVDRRRFIDALLWSTGLVRARPSILAVFCLPVALTLVTRPGPFPVAVAGEFVGTVGALFGRGYVAVVGGAALAGREPTVRATARLVCARLPAVVGGLVLAAAVVLAPLLVLVALALALEWLGVDAPAAVVVTAFAVGSVAIAFLVVKCCLVPEAALVGRYGPLESVRASWALTSLHRRRAVLAVAGLVALVVLEVALGDVGATGGPFTITVGYQGRQLELFAFGPAVEAGWLASIASAVASALYAGVFVHLWVQGIFER